MSEGIYSIKLFNINVVCCSLHFWSVNITR